MAERLPLWSLLSGRWQWWPLCCQSPCQRTSHSRREREIEGDSWVNWNLAVKLLFAHASLLEKVAHLCCAVDVFPPEHSIVQGHGCVVVNELKDLQPCHLGGLQDGPTLCLIEKGWNSDNCIFNGLLCEETNSTKNKKIVSVVVLLLHTRVSTHNSILSNKPTSIFLSQARWIVQNHPQQLLWCVLHSVGQKPHKSKLTLLKPCKLSNYKSHSIWSFSAIKHHFFS